MTKEKRTSKLNIIKIRSYARRILLDSLVLEVRLGYVLGHRDDRF